MTDLSISSLLAEEKVTEDRLKKLRETIRSLRSLCTHEFRDAGHDSHHNYVVRTRCGHEESR